MKFEYRETHMWGPVVFATNLAQGEQIAQQNGAPAI